MLILTRKKDESIIIDGKIEIKIIAVDGDKIRLGIDAPREVEIYRKELFDQIQEENKMAMHTKDNLDKLKELFIKKD